MSRLQSGQYPGRQTGVALLAALILMLALVITMGNIFYRHQIDVSQATGARHTDQAILLAISGENWAKQLLSDSSDDRGVDHFEEDWAQAMPMLPVEGGTLTGCLSDLQGRINLNNFSGYTSQTLKAEMGADTSGYARVWEALLVSLEIVADPSRSATIIDWLDPDSELINSWGAEQIDYDGYTPPRVPANGLITDTTELAAIGSYEVAEVQRLLPWISALPRVTPININTASTQLLTALGGSMGLEFEQMVSERRPFSSVDEFHQFIAERTQLALPLVKTRWPVTVVGVNSNYFELYLEVTLGEARIEVKSIMDRAGLTEPVILAREITMVPARLPKPASSALDELFDDSSDPEPSENPDEDQSTETNNVQSACTMIGEAY
ncbi:MAG: type II secretion system minor pseudopilin GspK [Porticoccaceae bacterium]|jgi:general secretion pathway protein K|nr:type II secretion system minor pseudopilin GspK [Porticoccaceae bacterium]